MDFLLTTASIKRLIYLFLVTGCALLSAYSVQENSQYGWIIASAFILSLLPLGNHFRHGIIVILLSGLTAALLIFLIFYIAPFTLALAVYFLLITMTFMFLSQQYPRYALPAFIINFLVLLSATLPVSAPENGDRLLMMLAGIFIAAAGHVIALPHFKRNRLQYFLVLSLQNLMRLNAEIFSCYLQPEYPRNLYLFERRLHIQKNRYLQSMKNLSLIMESMKNKEDDKPQVLTDWLTRLNLLYDIMLSYSELRFRVSDHSTFAVCELELTAILKEMDSHFSEAIAIFAHQKHHLHTSMLREKIAKLEENYHHVLQVAAREPLVFLLFISSLRMFNEEINKLRDVGLKVRGMYLWPT